MSYSVPTNFSPLQNIIANYELRIANCFKSVYKFNSEEYFFEATLDGLIWNNSGLEKVGFLNDAFRNLWNLSRVADYF